MFFEPVCDCGSLCVKRQCKHSEIEACVSKTMNNTMCVLACVSIRFPEACLLHRDGGVSVGPYSGTRAPLQQLTH